MTSIQDLELQNRIFNDFEDKKEQQLIQDLLWADPDPSIDGYTESPRGCAWNFGFSAAGQFCQQGHYDLILRAHQLQSKGYSQVLNDRVLTVWSASNYEQRCGNSGAFVLYKNGELFVRRFEKVFLDAGVTESHVHVDYFL